MWKVFHYFVLIKIHIAFAGVWQKENQRDFSFKKTRYTWTKRKIIAYISCSFSLIFENLQWFFFLTFAIFTTEHFLAFTCVQQRIILVHNTKPIVLARIITATSWKGIRRLQTINEICQLFTNSINTICWFSVLVVCLGDVFTSPTFHFILNCEVLVAHVTSQSRTVDNGRFGVCVAVETGVFIYQQLPFLDFFHKTTLCNRFWYMF